jgi:hypothetical protein
MRPGSRTVQGGSGVSRGDVLGIGTVLSRSAREIRTRESIAQIGAMGGGAIAMIVRR